MNDKNRDEFNYQESFFSGKRFLFVLLVDFIVIPGIIFSGKGFLFVLLVDFIVPSPYIDSVVFLSDEVFQGARHL